MSVGILVLALIAAVASLIVEATGGYGCGAGRAGPSIRLPAGAYGVIEIVFNY
jgi:hypothetical protein